MTTAMVIAGIGNDYRRDDGAGPAVARYVAQRSTRLVDVGPVVEPLDLLGRWDGAALAVVVDATRSGTAPGTVQVVDLTAEPSGTRSTSTHGVGLAGVLRLAWAVGAAPARVVVVGIEGGAFGHGDTLSPEVASAVPEAARLVLELVGEAG